MGEAEDCQGHKYTRHIPCPLCDGSGNEPKWINLEDFAKLLAQAQCPHEHSSYQGSMRFNAGDVWEERGEVCNDCGVIIPLVKTNPRHPNTYVSYMG